MRIGVISDTHGAVPANVHKAFVGAGHIIHAGDIGGQHILEELALIAPVTAVYGNCDYPDDYYGIQEAAQIELEGTRVLVAHQPLLIKSALHGQGAIAAGTPLPHVAIHGHTHVLRDEYWGTVRVFCPGSPCRPRAGSASSVLLLDVSNGQVKNVGFVCI